MTSRGGCQNWVAFQVGVGVLTEVDEDELKRQPANVDNVVLPTEGIESDGVDVLVENKGD